MARADGARRSAGMSAHSGSPGARQGGGDEVGGAKAEALERGQSLLAQCVRSVVVATPIFGDGLRGRLQRPVRRLERQIREERLVAVGALAEIPQQRVCVEVRRIEVVWNGDELVVLGVPRHHRYEVTGHIAVMACT